MVMMVLMPLHVIEIIESLLQLRKILLRVLQISRLQVCIEAIQDLIDWNPGCLASSCYSGLRWLCCWPGTTSDTKCHLMKCSKCSWSSPFQLTDIFDVRLFVSSISPFVE